MDDEAPQDITCTVGLAIRLGARNAAPDEVEEDGDGD
jgi:hypothetical protein